MADNREIIKGNQTFVKTLVDNPSTKVEGFPLGVDYIVATEQVVNPDTGKKEYTDRQIAYYDAKAKVYSPRAKGASPWFVIDLETGGKWDPEKDAKLQQLILWRSEVEEGTEMWHYYNNQILDIYKEHAAETFIRTK